MDHQRCAVVLIAAALLVSGGSSAAASEKSSACAQSLIECGNRAEGVAKGDGFELGLYVPGTDGAPRDISGGANSCPGCRWEIVPACGANTPGSSTNTGDVTCPNAVTACASTGGILVDVFLKRPGEPWRTVSSFCSDPAQPVTTPAQLVAEAARQLRDLPLPQPGITAQPPGGTAVNLPTIFYAAPANPMTVTTTLRGFSASLTATPTTWLWDFGDGTTLATTEPGAAYPQHTITHTYRRRGTVTVTVTTTWSGSITIAQIGALPLTETVSRTSTAQVVIREARTELVSDSKD